MYMRGLTPAIECEVEGRPLLFTFDTGPSSTDRSVRYYELFRQQAASWKTHVVESAGAGGSIQQDTYIQPRVVMKAGTSTVTLNDVSILPVRMNAGIDVLFGNLGLDFVDSFESFSLNFSTMTFSFGAPRRIRVTSPDGRLVLHRRCPDPDLIGSFQIRPDNYFTSGQLAQLSRNVLAIPRHDSGGARPFHRRRALAGAGFFLAPASLLVRCSSQEAGRFSESSSLSATDVRILTCPDCDRHCERGRHPRH